MKFYSVAIVLCLLGVIAKSQTLSVQVTFEQVQPIGKAYRVFTYSVHPDATDKGDPDLGESEIPPFPPPGSTFSVNTVYVDSVEGELWFYPKDIRTRKEGKFVQDYPTNVQWSGTSLEMYVTAAFPKGVDSIWIYDNLDSVPGQYFSQKLVPGTRVVTTFPSHRKFIVRIWWDGSTTSVYESATGSAKLIESSPTNDVLILHTQGKTVQGFTVYNVRGEAVMEIPAPSGESLAVSVASLPMGMYSVVEHSTTSSPMHGYFVRR